MSPPPHASYATTSSINMDLAEPTALSDTQGTTHPAATTVPSKVNDRYYRRRNLDNEHPAAQWGVAAISTTASFKSPAEVARAAAAAGGQPRPRARRWDDLLSREAQCRAPSTIKAAAQYLSRPGMISLGGGLPTSTYFPFADVSTTVPAARPGAFSEEAVAAEGVLLRSGKHDLAEGSSIFDIATAYNYGQATGSAQLLRWVTEHCELLHAPPYADWGVNLTIGNTAALDISLRLLTERGDAVIVEMYTFSAVLDSLPPLGLTTVGVQLDEEGIIPSALHKLLQTWKPEERNGSKRPRVLYTIPTGQNPTGATMSLQRRKDIYQICQEFDVFILEDEPYYFLQMPIYGQEGPDIESMTHEAFLKSLVPSFVSIDTDGRVLRMDSLSKVIAPGTRIGWVIGPEQIINAVKMHMDVASQGPCGISQLLMFKLLDEHWGHSGYLDWLKYLRKEYTARRNAMVQACEKHLPREIVSWVPPMAGMFHWMKIDWRKHPQSSNMTAEQLEEQIFLRVIDHGALLIRGTWLIAEESAKQADMFFRATYAAAPLDQIELAIQRLGDALRKEFVLA